MSGRFPQCHVQLACLLPSSCFKDIVAAAEREVAEETGIEASAQGILCLHHRHGYPNDVSDLYFTVLMKALGPRLTFHIPAYVTACSGGCSKLHVQRPGATDPTGQTRLMPMHCEVGVVWHRMH